MDKCKDKKSVAVIVIGDVPQNCEECPKYLKRYCDESIKFLKYAKFLGEETIDVNRKDLCPIHEAIGIVKPNGDVEYFEDTEIKDFEKRCGNCRHGEYLDATGPFICHDVESEHYVANANWEINPIHDVCELWEKET